MNEQSKISLSEEIVFETKTAYKLSYESKKSLYTLLALARFGQQRHPEFKPETLLKLLYSNVKFCMSETQSKLGRNKNDKSLSEINILLLVIFDDIKEIFNREGIEIGKENECNM